MIQTSKRKLERKKSTKQKNPPICTYCPKSCFIPGDYERKKNKKSSYMKKCVYIWEEKKKALTGVNLAYLHDFR
jgi:hypothetical protein